MKYKCLILDHDDTVVESTATIHYPCFVEYLRERHPEIADKYSFEEYLVKNFDPGVIAFFRYDVGFSEEELKEEEAYWANYVESHTPKAYSGMREIITEFLARGGIIIVDSHSLTRYIERDWAHNGLPKPNHIYGWDIPREQRKPSPFTVLDAIERFSLSKDEVLVVDDLKPGYDMAKGAGVDFAAAGWAYDVPEIEAFMRKNCDYYLKSISELRSLVFGGDDQ